MSVAVAIWPVTVPLSLTFALIHGQKRNKKPAVTRKNRARTVNGMRPEVYEAAIKADDRQKERKTCPPLAAYKPLVSSYGLPFNAAAG